jgi:hypothetical protein
VQWEHSPQGCTDWTALTGSPSLAPTGAAAARRSAREPDRLGDHLESLSSPLERVLGVAGPATPLLHLGGVRRAADADEVAPQPFGRLAGRRADLRTLLGRRQHVADRPLDLPDQVTLPVVTGPSSVTATVAASMRNVTSAGR